MSETTVGELFAWMEVEPDGREGQISAMMTLGHPTMITLCHRDRRVAEGMRVIAEAHARRVKRPARLVRFTRTEKLEEFVP